MKRRVVSHPEMSAKRLFRFVRPEMNQTAPRRASDEIAVARNADAREWTRIADDGRVQREVLEYHPNINRRK